MSKYSMDVVSQYGWVNSRDGFSHVYQYRIPFIRKLDVSDIQSCYDICWVYFEGCCVTTQPTEKKKSDIFFSDLFYVTEFLIALMFSGVLSVFFSSTFWSFSLAVEIINFHYELKLFIIFLVINFKFWYKFFFIFTFLLNTKHLNKITDNLTIKTW